MNKLVIAACAALLAVQVQAATPRKPSAYGAIAYERTTQAWGTSHAARNDREARIDALQRCADKRCEVRISIRNGCGALADGFSDHPPIAMGPITAITVRISSIGASVPSPVRPAVTVAA